MKIETERLLMDLEDCVDKASHMMNGLLNNYKLDLDHPTRDDDCILAYNRNNILTDMRIMNDYICRAQKTLGEMMGGAAV